jgi:hypothetical protein
MEGDEKTSSLIVICCILSLQKRGGQLCNKTEYTRIQTTIRLLHPC